MELVVVAALFLAGWLFTEDFFEIIPPHSKKRCPVCKGVLCVTANGLARKYYQCRLCERGEECKVCNSLRAVR